VTEKAGTRVACTYCCIEETGAAVKSRMVASRGKNDGKDVGGLNEYRLHAAMVVLVY